MRLMRLALGLSALTLASTAMAQTAPVAPPTTTADLTAVKKDMISLRTLQETYYADRATYSVDQSALKVTLSDGVSLKILEAGTRGWAGTGTLAGTNGVSCAIFIGAVSTIPKTERGAPAEKEGVPVCDGVTP